MTKLIAIFFLFVTLASCQKKSEPLAAKPSDAVLQAYAAVNARDTTAYVKSICESRRQALLDHPGALTKYLQYWQLHHYDVQIASESVDGGVAVVNYHLKVTGKYPEDTSLSVQVYKENNEWKFGY